MLEENHSLTRLETPAEGVEDCRIQIDEFLNNNRQSNSNFTTASKIVDENSDRQCK
jgi:hypothetical protein